MLVVGGGIIGLAVSRQLARDGWDVTILERGRPAEEASWAAAGMLSPLGESESGPFRALALDSHARYPEWTAAVEEESGHAVDLRPSGRLVLARSSERAAALRQECAVLSGEGHAVEWLSRPDARAHLSTLSEDIEGAAWHALDAHVDNRKLGPALLRAAERAGVAVRCGSGVSHILMEGGRAAGVRLDSGDRLPGERVIVAAGAWSGMMDSPHPVPVRPVRGQMLALAPAATPPEHPIVDSGDVYVIPRAGRMLVGATVEEAGFDRTLSPANANRLRSGAVRALPGLAGASVDEEWIGFRPGTPDGHPVLGWAPDVEGLLLATGHYRNGILLAPVTAALVADLLAGHPAPLAQAFAPSS